MRSFLVPLMLMLSFAELLFTLVYIFLTLRIDAIPVLGAGLYAVTLAGVYRCYATERYENQKKEFLENLPT